MDERIDPKTIGDRLRAARDAVGATQSEAAAAVKLARTTLVAIESGTRAVRPQELIALAKFYGTDVHTLVRSSALHVPIVAQYRRTAFHAKDEQDALQAVKLLHRLATSTVELERRLGRPLRTSYPAVRSITKGRLDQQAEDLAQELRSRLGLGLAAIADLISIAELELGLRVFLAPLPSRIGGVFTYHAELGACVLLNVKHPYARLSWTLAHEIGHFLTSRDVTSVAFSESDRSDVNEAFANRFANALLMPGIAIRRAVAEWSETSGRFSSRHLVLLAHQYVVSIEAMCRRLSQLGLVPDGTYEALRRKGLNKAIEEEIVGPETPRTLRPSRLAILGVEALLKGILSEGQFAEMLSVDRVEVRRLIDLLSDDTDLLG